MSLNFDFPKEERSIIKVIGVGGGGSNAVNQMYNQGIVGVDFAICNTDAQAMEISKVPVKIQLGPGLTEGRGAGSKPQVGEQACMESIDEVKSFLMHNTKMLFITAGMGGGTGTGAAPVIAKAAQELGILTVGIVTIPFKFEGRIRCSHAAKGIDNLKDNVDALIVISNNKLREIYGNLELSRAFANADDILTTAAKGIAEIITVPGLVNVDFEDVNTVMRNSGVAIMGAAVAEGENRARKAIDLALNSPLLEDSDIRGAEQILLNVTSGEKEITMDEIFEITEYIQEEAGEESNLIWGNCVDKSLGEKVSVTLIATGFEDNSKSGKRESSQQKTTRMTSTMGVRQEDDAPEESKIETSTIILRDETKTANEVEFDIENESNEQGEVKDPEQEKILAATKEEVERRRKENIESTPGELTKEVINEMESEPAYLRRKIKLEELKNSGDSELSRMSITDDEDDPLSKRRNSYLHDNVD
ncbi:MAG: cell division protein FtsZ [Saprospirales bacterium]|nr:MAG: cell division protein FtsZ [Saprospirales bacterium]